MSLNILCVTTDFPYPLRSGGDVALYYRIKELSKKGHHIYLFSTTRSTVKEESIQELKRYCNNVKIYEIGKSELLFNLFIFPLMPFRTIRRFSRKMQRDIKNFLNSNKIDIFLIEHSNMAVYFSKEHPKDIKSVLVFESLAHKSFFREAKHYPSFFSFKKLISYIESFKTRPFEYAIFKSNIFDEFWFYSTDDIQDVLTKFPKLKDKIKFIPVGVELKIDSEIKTEEIQGLASNDKMILTIGSMDNPSNEDATRWFAGKIFPKIKSKIPNAKFCVVGTNSKYKLKDISSENIIVIGEVPDLRPYLNRCDLYVVPQRGGAGIRVKLLDGLSAKKVVIATPIGVEAMENIEPGVHFLLARDEKEFADKAVEVLKDPEKFEKIAENGFNFIKTFFSTEVVGNIVEEYLLNLTN